MSTMVFPGARAVLSFATKRAEVGNTAPVSVSVSVQPTGTARLAGWPAGKLVGSSMGFIDEGGIQAQSGTSGACGVASPSGPEQGRGGYFGFPSSGYAYAPPVMVRTCARLHAHKLR